MFEKAVCYQPMDYQVVFWGYTFAIKKLTWFAQVVGRWSWLFCFLLFCV